MDGSGPSALSLRNMRTIGDRPRGRRQGGSRARPIRLLFRLLRMSPEPRRVDVLDGGPWTTGAHTATSIASMTKASIMVSAPSETRTPQSSHHFAAEFCPIEFWNHTGSTALPCAVVARLRFRGPRPHPRYLPTRARRTHRFRPPAGGNGRPRGGTRSGSDGKVVVQFILPRRKGRAM
jgi:hypothetical protein